MFTAVGYSANILIMHHPHQFPAHPPQYSRGSHCAITLQYYTPIVMFSLDIRPSALESVAPTIPVINGWWWLGTSRQVDEMPACKWSFRFPIPDRSSWNCQHARSCKKSQEYAPSYSQHAHPIFPQSTISETAVKTPWNAANQNALWGHWAACWCSMSPPRRLPGLPPPSAAAATSALEQVGPPQAVPNNSGGARRPEKAQAATSHCKKCWNTQAERREQTIEYNRYNRTNKGLKQRAHATVRGGYQAIRP